MKKNKLWKILGGIILIIISVVVLAQLLFSHPSKLTEILASVSTIICWGGLGVFLIYSYLNDKDKEDTGATKTPVVPNSHEDIASLSVTRKNMLASVLLIETFGSIPSWITNNYLAGFVPENVSTITDIIVHIPIVFLIITLYKQKNVLPYLFYTMLVYAVFATSIAIWDTDPLSGLANVAFCIYFLYYTKCKIVRRNHRIANYIILPLLLIIPLISSYIVGYQTGMLYKQEASAETLFVSAEANVIEKYKTLSSVERYDEYPNAVLNLNSALQIKAHRTHTLLDLLSEIRTIQKSIPNKVSLEFTEKKITALEKFIHANQELDSKISKVTLFIDGLDLNNVTKQDSEAYIKLDSDVRSASVNVEALRLEITTAEPDVK